MVPISSELDKIIRQNVQDESAYLAIRKLMTHDGSSATSQINYLKRLHQLTTTQYSNLETLFLAYLRVGCDVLGMEYGIVRQIEHDTTFTQAIFPRVRHQPIEIPLNQVICRYVVEQPQTLTLHDTRYIQSLRQSDVACYIGTPLIVDQNLWGTISFYHSQAKEQSFTESEIEFVELLAQNINQAIRNQSRQQKSTPRHYNFIFENIDTPILMYDVDTYEIIEANPAASAFYGYSLEEFSSLSMVDINMLPPSDIEKKIIISRKRGRPYVHFPHRLKMGEVREVEDYTHDMRVNNRHVRFSIIYDYSDHHESEEALKHSEANLRAIFDNTSQVMFLVDDTANIVAMNRAASRLNEDIGDISSNNIDTLHHSYIKADRYLVSDYIDRALHGHVTTYESYTTVNNKPLYINYRYVPVRTPDDQIIGVCVTGQDVTSLKVSQENLARERNILRTLIDNLPDAIYIKDAAARLLMANQSYVDTTHATVLEEILGKNALELYPEFGEKYYQDDITVISQNTTINQDEFILMPNNMLRTASVTKVPLHNKQGDVIGLVGIGRDITEQREIENALHLRDEILNTLNDAAQRFLKDGNWRDRIGAILEQLGKSLKIERVYLKRNITTTTSEGAIFDYEWTADGIAKHESYPKSPAISRWSEILYRGELLYGHINDMKDDEQEIMITRGVRSFVMAPVMVNSQWWGSLGFDAIHSDRHWHPVELEAVATAASTLGAAIQREQIEQGLRDNEEKFTQLVTHIPEAFWIYDASSQELIYANANYETIFGVTVQDRQKDVNLFLAQVHPDDRQLVIDSLERQSRGEISQYEARFLEENGGIRWISVRIYPIHNDAHNIHRVAGIASDTTQQKQVEAVRVEMLAQQERISILSSFFRDASHEFKTPLSIINTSVYILGKTEDAETRRTHYDLIRQQVHDVSDLVETLVLMSRLDTRAELTFSPLNINSIIRQIDYKIHESYPNRADDFQISVDQSLPLILGHLNYITQALNNLIDNAVRYSSLGDTIYLRTYHDDRFVVIEVEDEGIGISEAELQQIFKRFYRSDEAHSTRGFGLGLPIAQRIAQRHGGDVLVESELHRGSVFRLIFPMIQVLNG